MGMIFLQRTIHYLFVQMFLFLAVFSVITTAVAESAANSNRGTVNSVSSTLQTVRLTLSNILFGQDYYMDFESCTNWFGGNNLEGERGNQVSVICGQIICPKTTNKQLSSFKGDISSFRINGCSTESTVWRIDFYVIFGFLPLVVLFYIFYDLLLLFSFVTPRTSKMLAFVISFYAVYMSNGLFSVVLGIMSLLGGPYGGFNFIKLFFGVLLFSLLAGFFFDSIFRFFIETSRVSKALQYQMYEIAAETQLGKYRARFY